MTVSKRSSPAPEIVEEAKGALWYSYSFAHAMTTDTDAISAIASKPDMEVNVVPSFALEFTRGWCSLRYPFWRESCSNT